MTNKTKTIRLVSGELLNFSGYCFGDVITIRKHYVKAGFNAKDVEISVISGAIYDVTLPIVNK